MSGALFGVCGVEIKIKVVAVVKFRCSHWLGFIKSASQDQSGHFKEIKYLQNAQM